MKTSGNVNRYHTLGWWATVAGWSWNMWHRASHSSCFCSMLPGADCVEWPPSCTPSRPALSPQQTSCATDIGRFKAAGPECCRLFWCLAASPPLARCEDPLLSLPYIGVCPWTPVSITATTQLPARRRRPLHLLKTLLPSPAARRRIVAEIVCALPNLSWNHSIQLLATEASHAYVRPPREPSERTRRGDWDQRNYTLSPTRS
jgi:hypothetical protein